MTARYHREMASDEHPEVMPRRWQWQKCECLVHPYVFPLFAAEDQMWQMWACPHCVARGFMRLDVETGDLFFYPYEGNEHLAKLKAPDSAKR